MAKLNKGRTGKPIVLSAGVDIRSIPLAKNSLPAQEKSAYEALFEVALRYPPEEAAEGLAMILSVCMRTLAQTENITDTVDLKTDTRYRTITRLVNMTEQQEPDKKKKPAKSKKIN